MKRDEGYSIRSLTDRNRLWIVVSGHDDRGMLYGLGYLLRHTDWSGGRAKLDVPAACVAPALAVRGGSRPLAADARSQCARIARRWPSDLQDRPRSGDPCPGRVLMPRAWK